MTQTLTPAAPTAAMTAVVENLMFGGTRLHFIPMEDAAVARAEWPDAVAYVQETSCTECGHCRRDLQTCTGCSAQLCGCEISDDDHDDRPYCDDCAPRCDGCRRCV